MLFKVPRPPPRRPSSPRLALPPCPAPRPQTLVPSAPSAFSPSNVLFAAKALFVATALVGTGAFALIHTVRYTTGVRTISEFNHLMRCWACRHLPRLSPDDPDESSWQEAEARLKHAYDQGGLSAWFRVLFTELEAEEAAREKIRTHN